MKIKNIKSITIVLMIIFAFTSCEKEELAVVEPQATLNQDILTFATQEDFDKTLAKVNAMTKDQRMTWEKEQGFKSFGTICDEFYETIQPESFKSDNDVKTFVAKNNDKIEFYTCSDGEIYCITKEFKTIDRYLLNKDRMYIVGTKAYKKFDEELVSTNISNIEKLFMAKNFSDLDMNSALIQKSTNSNVTQDNKSDSRMIKGPNIFENDWYRIHAWISTQRINQFHVTTLTIKNFFQSGGFWYIKNNVNVTYSISYTVTDSQANKHSFSVAKTVKVGGAGNYDSMLLSEECEIGQYISSPYFSTYYVSAENTITDSDGTCHCKVIMNY